MTTSRPTRLPQAPSAARRSVHARGRQCAGPFSFVREKQRSPVLVTPLVLWAAADAMYALAYSDPSFDASGLVLTVAPAALVSAAAVRSARAGLRDVHGQTNGRALARSATVVAYVIAGLTLAAALLSLIAMMGQGG